MESEIHDVVAVRSGSKPRRPHKKAKTGCLNCRRRRVKCTEEKPKCRACLRRGVECEYPSFQGVPFSSPATQHEDEASPQSTSSQSSKAQGIAPVPSLSSSAYRSVLGDARDKPSVTYGIDDMALFHHWTVSTSLHVYKNSALSLTCQVIFPKIAFRHPFVMQALLAVTALHIAYLEPEESSRYTIEAARYHIQGLKGFNEAISHSNQEAAEALFVWSSLNLLYVFAASGRLGEGLWDDSSWGGRKERILGSGWVPMLQGVQTVMTPFYDTLSKGQLRDLLNVGNWDDIDPDLGDDIDDKRFCQTREVWKDNPDASTYEETLYILRKCRMFMAQFLSMEAETPGDVNRAWQGAFLFVPFASERYFALLHQRQPPALILYAYYGALLHSINDSWFMEGWGYDIVGVVDDLLGSYWERWISWPLEVVGLRAENMGLN
ncbi:UPC2-like protein [Fusarium beomiforme]|uniref:UPC2-like protein n=1 Tax=Fusarium beomiforme TaxID=44412 RepID=A0A9P5AMV3_9HYPO|nr:UPC2-like protein [Fusarium beomiforme]